MHRGGGRGGGGGGGYPFPNFGDPFAGFNGGFGGVGNMMPSFFGGNPFSESMFPSPFGGVSPFSDPFFARPFGPTMFDSGFFGPMVNPFVNMPPPGFVGHREAPEPTPSRGLVIEEINSDDDDEKDVSGQEAAVENPRKHRRLSNVPYVEDPDDVVEEKKSRVLPYRNDYNEFNQSHSQPQTRSFTFQSSSVAYGGPNGAYYSSSKTRRTGSDGVTFEESKEADTSTGQASHRVSKGLHNKGHSVTRKLKSDGNVNTMQTLHNINEDELPGFEEAWKGSAKKHLHGLDYNSGGHEISGASGSRRNGRGGWALPSTESSQQSGRAVLDDGRNSGGVSHSQQFDRTRVADTSNRNSYYPHGRERN